MSSKKRKSKKPRHSERLEYQFRYKIDRQVFPTQEAAQKAVQRARDAFLQGGFEIDGVHTVVSWRNPDSRSAHSARWKDSDEEGQSLQDVFETLHGGRPGAGAFHALKSTVVRTPQVQKREEVRIQHSSAMKKYHETLRSLLKPGWTYARARKEYRRKFKRRSK